MPINSPLTLPIYIVPAPELLKQFAHQACQLLDEAENADFGQPEIVRGFFEFLQVIAQISAQQLNDGRLLQ